VTSSQTAAQVANASPVSWRDFGWLAVQLAALTFLVFFYRIENDAFARFTLLTAAGFGVHYFLPFRLRLPFLVTLSLVGLILVLGPVNAAWVVGIGLALIGIAHTPVPMVVRAGMLAGIGVVLAVPRWGLGHVPWSSAIWPILGSMFVFRMMSYLYDVGNGLKPGRPAQVLAYFFLLPNVCFPLFPLVDFKRFVRGYYDSDRHRIYQVGVEWIWRGLLQLIAYRLIYFHLTLDPVDVENIADLAGYIVSTYLLYVRL
jgi:hypothetical protein